MSQYLALACAAGGIIALLCLGDGRPVFNQQWWALGFFALLQYVLMMLAVPVNAFGSSDTGHISFDRLPLVAAPLLFGPIPAAWAAGGAALAFTLTINPYREAGRALLIRVAGNAGMYLLATLAAGYAWLGLGGTIPIDHFGLINIDRIAVLIITLQATNEVLYIALNRPGMNAAARRRLLNWPTSLLEFVLGWTGVAVARAYLTQSFGDFALTVLFVLIIAVLLKFYARIVKREQRRAEELAAVNRVNQAVAATTDLDALIETIFREARALMPFSAFIFGLYSPARGEVDIRLNHDRGRRHPSSAQKPGEGITGWVARHRQAVFIADTRTSTHPALRTRVTRGEPAIAIAAVPINFQNEVVGVMSAQDYYPNAFSLHQLNLLQGFAGQVATAIVNTRLFAELQGYQSSLEQSVARRTRELEQAYASLSRAAEEKEALLRQLEQENRYDALTGLANRRCLENALRQEHYRARRFGHPLSIAVVDIDHFKKINDNWGHLLGDKVLSEIAHILRSELRATDVVARYGGEEFVILLPETASVHALHTCDKLREKVAAHPWDDLVGGLEVTMSFGVCDNTHTAQDYTGMLAAADNAMYRAKSAGRNRGRRCEDAESA